MSTCQGFIIIIIIILTCNFRVAQSQVDHVDNVIVDDLIEWNIDRAILERIRQGNTQPEPYEVDHQLKYRPYGQVQAEDCVQIHFV